MKLKPTVHGFEQPFQSMFMPQKSHTKAIMSCDKLSCNASLMDLDNSILMCCLYTFFMWFNYCFVSPLSS